MDNFTQALGHNREAIDQAVKDAGALIKSLNASAPKLDAALTDAGTLMKSLNASAPKLDAALDSVGSLAKSFDTAKIGRTVDNVDRFAQALSDRSQDIDQTIVAARQLAQNLNATAPKLDTAIANAGALVKSLNARRRSSMPPSTASAISPRPSIRQRSDGRSTTSTRFAQTLSNRSQDVDQTIIEARQLSEKLNKSADRVDGVLKAAQDFLGSAAGEEGKSAFEEIRGRRALDPRPRRQSRQAHRRDHHGHHALHRLGAARIPDPRGRGTQDRQRHWPGGAQPRAQSAAIDLRRSDLHPAVQRTPLSSCRMRSPSERSFLHTAGLQRRVWSLPCYALAALVGACSSGPPPATYDLSAPAARVRSSLGLQVLVQEPAAVQALAGQQIIVKDASGAISFLGGAQWAASLPSLVQTRLVHTFENSSQIRAVALPSSGATGRSHALLGAALVSGRDAGGRSAGADRGAMISSQSGRIVAGRIFTARVPIAAIDGPNAARALDEALSAVMLDIVRWVSSGRPAAARAAERGSVAPASTSQQRETPPRASLLRIPQTRPRGTIL